LIYDLRGSGIGDKGQGFSYKNILSLLFRPTSSRAGFVTVVGFDEEGKAHEEVVVALRGINHSTSLRAGSKVHGLTGTEI
jgi:hypothetical protein